MAHRSSLFPRFLLSLTLSHRPAVSIVASVSREVERASRNEQPPKSNRFFFLSPSSYGIANLEPFVLDLSTPQRNHNVEQEERGSRDERDG
jgi:hypothetical protein